MLKHLVIFISDLGSSIERAVPRIFDERTAKNQALALVASVELSAASSSSYSAADVESNPYAVPPSPVLEEADAAGSEDAVLDASHSTAATSSEPLTLELRQNDPDFDANLASLRENLNDLTSLYQLTAVRNPITLDGRLYDGGKLIFEARSSFESALQQLGVARVSPQLGTDRVSLHELKGLIDEVLEATQQFPEHFTGSLFLNSLIREASVYSNALTNHIQMLIMSKAKQDEKVRDAKARELARETSPSSSSSVDAGVPLTPAAVINAERIQSDSSAEGKTQIIESDDLSDEQLTREMDNLIEKDWVMIGPKTTTTVQPQPRGEKANPSGGTQPRANQPGKRRPLGELDPNTAGARRLPMGGKSARASNQVVPQPSQTQEVPTWGSFFAGAAGYFFQKQ